MSVRIDDLANSDDFLGDLGRRYAREFMAKQETLPPKPDEVEAMVCERVGTFRLVLLLAGAEPDAALAGAYAMWRALVDENKRLSLALPNRIGTA